MKNQILEIDSVDIDLTNKKRFFHLILLMATIVLSVVFITLYILYKNDMKQAKYNLGDALQSQKQMIEAVGRFDIKNSINVHKGGSVAATLSQVIDARQHFIDEHKYSEFLLGKYLGDKVWLIINNSDIQHGMPSTFDELDNNTAIITPIDLDLAIPMKMALKGKTGTIIDLDYNGVEVLAAYTPLNIGNEKFGIVTKINLSTITQPFYNATIIVIFISIILIIFGAIGFNKIYNPILEQLNKGLIDYKKANLKTESTNEYLNTIIEGSFDGIITINKKGIILTFNNSAQKQFGYLAEEVIGKNVKILVPPPHHDVHDNYINNYIQTGKTKIIGSSRNVDAKQKDGTLFPISLGLSVIDFKGEPVFVGTIHELTKEKEALKLAKKAVERFDQAMMVTEDGLWDWHVPSSTVYFSPAWKSMLGYKDDELENNFSTWEGLLHPNDLEYAKSESLKLIKDSNINYNIKYRLLCKDGSYKWILSRAKTTKLDENGKAIRIIGTHVDITEQKLLEDSLSEKVEKAVSKIREKDEMILKNARLAAMGEMIGMIAHQWRQPITGIGMIASNLTLDIEMEMWDDTKAKLELEQINSQVQYLSKTIDDFRNFFKPQKERVLCSAQDLISETIQIIGKSLQNNNIEIILKVDETITLNIYKNEMIQVLLNIFKNAQDVFIEAGRDDGKITVEYFLQDDKTVIGIEDNAGGISIDLIDNIFEPYFSTKDEKTGTGLGLYMSKTIVEEHHHGKIDVHNIENGVRFEIKL